MDNRIALIATLVLVVLVAGAWWRFSTGRAKLVRSGEIVDLGKLKATEGGKPITSFGKKVTPLQFSTEFCSICVQTAKLYKNLEKTTPGLKHIEVDVTDRMDLAAHFNLMQTPTTLILNKHVKLMARIGGAPRENEIAAEIEKMESK